MTNGAWGLLGLEPTKDEAAIRRAYARRLKLTRPDENPLGFQALLAAREWALSEARRGPGRTVLDDPDPPRASDPLGDIDRLNAADVGLPHTPEQEPLVPLIVDEASDESGCDEPIEPALVRDLSEPPSAEAPISQPDLQPPTPDVIDVAPLEAGPAEWVAARALVRSVPTLDRTGGPVFAAWMAEVRRLSHGPRRTVETALLQALFAAWRGPDGGLAAPRVAATRAAVGQAAPVFGWPREDAVLAATFSPQDAAVAIQVLRDLLPPEHKDPAVATVPVGLRRCLPLHASDARAFLEAAPHALKAYEAMRRGEPVALRLPVAALLAPHLWALAHKRWGVALAVLAALWSSFLLSGAAVERAGAVAVALALLSGLVWVATVLATAMTADRILVSAAARAARRAARKGIYAPGDRTARLRKAGTRLGFWSWAMIAWLGAILIFTPYLGPIILVRYALGLDPVKP